MEKSVYKNLQYFRIDGECSVPSDFAEGYRKIFEKKKDIDIAGAITEIQKRKNYGHFLHTCFYKQKAEKNETFHFLYQIDRLKLRDTVKDLDSELYRKIDKILTGYEFLYKCKARVIFKFGIKEYGNQFGFPKSETMAGLKLRIKGSIFVLENEPRESYLCETTKTDFVIAKQFKLIKFKYSRSNIEDIIVRNSENMAVFLKGH